MPTYYLAVDIGASSGRHILGWVENGKINLEEVYRFPNGVQEQNGHLVWDVDALYLSVVEGIAKAFAKYPEIESLSVDTWGVDYALLDENDQAIGGTYCYRDSRTEETIPEVHAKIPFEQLFAKTPFHSKFSLCFSSCR